MNHNKISIRHKTIPSSQKIMIFTEAAEYLEPGPLSVEHLKLSL